MSDYTRTWPRTTALDPDEAADIAAYWSQRPWVTDVAKQRGHTLRFYDDTPVRIAVTTPEPTSTAYDYDYLDLTAPGLPLNIPRRHERSFIKQVFRVLGAKYRRVFA